MKTMLTLIHRGDRSHHPENTIPALTDALASEDGIETDVQISIDGQLYLFHDENLHPLTNGQGMIHNLNSIQINKVRILSNDKEYRIATLDELFQVNSKYKKILNLEIKTRTFTYYSPHDIIERIYLLTKKYNMLEHVIVSSYSLEYLYAYAHTSLYTMYFGLLVEAGPIYDSIVQGTGIYDKIKDNLYLLILDKDLPIPERLKYKCLLGVYTLNYNEKANDIYQIRIVDKIIQNNSES